MNVAQILKAKGRAVTTARPDASLLDISSKLAAKKIGAVIIVGDNGRVVGIVSERDIIRAVAERGQAALKATVLEVMTRNVVSCQENATLDELMELMTQGRFRHMPVLEDDALVGIISIGDLVKAIIADQKFLIEQLERYISS